MQFYPHRTVEEQAERVSSFNPEYPQTQIDKILIKDAGDDIEVTGYAEYSYFEEKSYVEQPVRTVDGAIHDLDEYKTFLTPRLIIKYNMMNIEDYRKLMKMLKYKNTFTVECYDVVRNIRIVNEMYCAPPSMPIIYQRYLKALGIKECTIELIGTNTMPTINPMRFYINGEEYIVTSGLTWGQWATYRNLDFSVKYFKDYSCALIVDETGNAIYDNYFVDADEQIIERKYYTTEQP